jgi:CubicO group peptidase (beta-lactamase class C family)
VRRSDRPTRGRSTPGVTIGTKRAVDAGVDCISGWSVAFTPAGEVEHGPPSQPNELHFRSTHAMPRTYGLVITCVVTFLAGASAQDLKTTHPGVNWERVKPELAGYSSARLAALGAWLKTQQTTALVVSVGGRLIFEYGDTSRVSKVASVRKSILAMLFGNYAAQGKVNFDATVEQLGLEDVQPFLPIEKHATLTHLLTARSGIYLPSGNDTLTSLSPRRGAQAPGTHFQYQNWDFNAAGAAFEKITGTDVFDALEKALARPIGMQDFDRTRQRKVSALSDSVHPEYAMYLSTRDMARIGVLMARGCSWAGKPVFPRQWCQYITTLVTPQHDLHPSALGLATEARRWGYGVLWWVWDARAWPGVVSGPYDGAYAAMGANGQYIVVLPALDLVVAHKVDFDVDGSREVRNQEFDAILQMVIASACSGPCK